MKSAVVFGAVLMQGASAAIGFVDWWKMAWCDFGTMYNFSTFACGTPIKSKVTIPAG